MRHFPIYLDTSGQTIIVSGVGACAEAKLRLILKTEARVQVFGHNPTEQIAIWAREGRLTHHARALQDGDVDGALLLYAANDDARLDRQAKALGVAAGVKVLVVDNLAQSDFITPAIVDRDPVTVAIGTEGAAPVLARKIKAELEATLPASLGPLARIGQAFRPHAARLPMGRVRRQFWARFYDDLGPRTLPQGAAAVMEALAAHLTATEAAETPPGHVHFVGAGPGDPELLTLKARRLLHDADVVIHDRLVSAEVMELARREARIIEVGKTPFGPSWAQDDINALLVKHGAKAQVVRLKSGDCSIFGRLEEETDALQAAGVGFSITPGITAASAASAAMKTSLTRRGRNSALRIITGHEAAGFAEQDWRALAQPDAIAAIYMGKAAADFLRGRLIMHGRAPHTPVTIVENASRADQRILPATLLTLGTALEGIAGPAVLMLGLAPHDAAQHDLREAL